MIGLNGEFCRKVRTVSLPILAAAAFGTVVIRQAEQVTQQITTPCIERTTNGIESGRKARRAGVGIVSPSEIKKIQDRCASKAHWRLIGF